MKVAGLPQHKLVPRGGQRGCAHRRAGEHLFASLSLSLCAACINFSEPAMNNAAAAAGVIQCMSFIYLWACTLTSSFTKRWRFCVNNRVPVSCANCIFLQQQARRRKLREKPRVQLNRSRPSLAGQGDQISYLWECAHCTMLRERFHLNAIVLLLTPFTARRAHGSWRFGK